MSVNRYEYFLKVFTAHSEKPLVYLDNGKTISYQAFLNNSIRLLNHLVDQGLRYGDSVVINLENRVEYLELMLALCIGGVTAYPVDPGVSVGQLTKIKNLSRARLCITSYNQLAYALDDRVPDCANQGDMNFPYLVVFSSGTTGAPKGIVQSAANFYQAATSFASALALTEHDLTLHNWPMFYNAGLFNLFAAPLMSGGSIAIGKRFSAKHMDQFWRDVQQFKPTQAYLSPTMATSLARTFRFFKHDKDVLAGTKIVSTSSILYPSIKQEFRETFGVDMIACFGITELGGSFTVGHTVSGPFSVGRLIDGVEVRVDDEQDGEVLVKSPYMALGYLNEDGTIAAFDREAFFRTGDLGRMDGDELFISGRKKDAIKKGGEFIQLTEIEDLVLGSNLCNECLAIGRADLFWGEVYDLVFVANSPDTVTATKDAISRLLNDALPYSQRPSEIKAVNEIPKTSSGKPIKRLTHFEGVSVE
ncbi:class I adenylate-forming enzyme family protein [Burkholderia vietnamiensis]|uniref:class I adenylate-forming enzyme family protein n=1 Tax=Burkholderia vietnamiensis TaxID=60552 RepID=UPI0008418333|nr:class I adenylate-forming enzyme family protein [Burkholderia vietnamiensis]AOJ12218.1 AMP-dependent synthetase [Burkholderia vietnamiensis]